MKNNYAQGLYDVSPDKKENLGTYRITPDGRKFRYAYCGTDQIEVGVTTSMIGVEANHINRSIAAAVAIGDMEVSVTVGATAVTADSYADGYFQVNDGTGEGHQYLIDSKTYCASSGTTIVTLKEPIRVALVTAATSQVSLIPNPWNGTVIQATMATGPAGVTITTVPINYYYWSQTGGHACVFTEGNAAMGTTLEHSDTNGNVEIANGYDVCWVGTVICTAGVAAEYKPVWLNID
jgi:hypothetical protein